jgi:hypothetical protein
LSGAYQPSGTAMHALAPPCSTPAKVILFTSAYAFDLKSGFRVSNSLSTETSIEFNPNGINDDLKVTKPSSSSFL